MKNLNTPTLCLQILRKAQNDRLYDSSIRAVPADL
nr:MAG TPA: hypothetical protein [Caudoviricetes sp.]